MHLSRPVWIVDVSNLHVLGKLVLRGYGFIEMTKLHSVIFLSETSEEIK